MKILVLVNEDFADMVLGRNTTLAYILAAVDMQHDVYIAKAPIDADDFSHLTAVHLNSSNASQLVTKYKAENHKIVDALSGVENQGSAEVLAGDFFVAEKISLPQKNISLNEIDFLIQRLEPMKSPFPPVGDVSIHDYLLQLKNSLSPKSIFNFPVNAYADKEFPLVLARNYLELATPTEISFYGDLELPQKLQKVAVKYSEIFSTAKQKIVVKPDDSAQALGVFAIEIKNSALDLAQLKTKTITELAAVQLYEININAAPQDIAEIINILCFVQFCKTKPEFDHRNIAKISKEEIASAIKSLYGKNILLQPFLEGVRLGDIRINLAKMSDDNFKVVGAVFRKSISYDEKNFTTCLTTGASMAQPVEGYLSVVEIKNLTQKIQFILQQLNHDEALKNKYREVLEIGCDFLVVGNGKDVYMGEANHYCPALMPFSESLEKAKKSNFYDAIDGLRLDYEGGLAIVKEIVAQQIALQNRHHL